MFKNRQQDMLLLLLLLWAAVSEETFASQLQRNNHFLFHSPHSVSHFSFNYNLKYKNKVWNPPSSAPQKILQMQEESDTNVWKKNEINAGSLFVIHVNHTIIKQRMEKKSLIKKNSLWGGKKITFDNKVETSRLSVKCVTSGHHSSNSYSAHSPGTDT